MSVQTALQWALSQQGVTENPPGSNHVTYWDAYQAETGVNGQGWPWCGCFVREALKHGGWAPPDDWISVWAIENWGRANNRWQDGAADVQAGDVLVLIAPGQHTGLSQGTLAGGELATIEGNTSAGDAGSQSNGGGVFSRLRPESLIVGYVRPPLPPDIPTPVLEDDMAKWVHDIDGTEYAATGVGKKHLTSPAQRRGWQNAGLLERTMIDARQQPIWHTILAQLPTLGGS